MFVQIPHMEPHKTQVLNLWGMFVISTFKLKCGAKQSIWFAAFVVVCFCEATVDINWNTRFAIFSEVGYWVSQEREMGRLQSTQ